MQQVFYQDAACGVLDALVWLGADRADRAAYAVRLVQYSYQGISYQYFTNVLDPAQLPLLASTPLKREMGLALWWGASPDLVLIQLWLALILMTWAIL